MKIIKLFAIMIIAIIVVIIGSYHLGYQVGMRHAPERVTEVCDTVVRIDTIVHERPVYVRQKVVDTMLVAVRDTLRLSDTTYIALPRTERTYTDSTYKAIVSGYRPSLDYIEVHPRTMTISTTETVYKDISRWSLGIAAGPGALLDFQGKAHYGVAAVIGLNYRF